MRGETVHEYIHFLAEHGIDWLTGEACGLGMRGLCDLNDQGQEILKEALGIEAPFPGMNNPRGKVVKLFREMIEPLVAFCLFYDGAQAVIMTNYRDNAIHSQFVYGIFDATSEEIRETVSKFNETHHGSIRVLSRQGDARNGLSNRHQFSGRVD